MVRSVLITTGYAVLVVVVSVHYQLLLESNRLIHFLLCASLIYLMRKIDNYALFSTMAVVFSIGIAKELRDPIFDWLDVLANTLGILVGILL